MHHMATLLSLSFLFLAMAGCVGFDEEATDVKIPFLRIGDEFYYEGSGRFHIQPDNWAAIDNREPNWTVTLEEGEGIKIIVSESNPVLDTFGRLHPAYSLDYYHTRGDEERAFYTEHMSLETNRLIYSKEHHHTKQPAGSNAARTFYHYGYPDSFSAALFQGGSLKLGDLEEQYLHPDPVMEARDVGTVMNAKVEPLQGKGDGQWVRVTLTSLDLLKDQDIGIGEYRFESGIPFPAERITYGRGRLDESTLTLSTWNQGEGPEIRPDSANVGEWMIRFDTSAWDGKFTGRISKQILDPEDAHEIALDDPDTFDFLETHPEARLVWWDWSDSGDSPTVAGTIGLPRHSNEKHESWLFTFADFTDIWCTTIESSDYASLGVHDYTVDSGPCDVANLTDAGRDPWPDAIPIQQLIEDLKTICPKAEPISVGMDLSWYPASYSIRFPFLTANGDQDWGDGARGGEPGVFRFDLEEGRIEVARMPSGAPNPCEPYIP